MKRLFAGSILGLLLMPSVGRADVPPGFSSVEDARTKLMTRLDAEVMANEWSIEVRLRSNNEKWIFSRPKDHQSPSMVALHQIAVEMGGKWRLIENVYCDDPASSDCIKAQKAVDIDIKNFDSPERIHELGLRNGDSPASIDMRCRTASPPSYRAQWAKQGMRGVAILLVETTPKGKIGSVTIERSSGYTELDASAMKSAKTFCAKPSTSLGVPATQVMRVPIEFDIPGG